VGSASPEAGSLEDEPMRSSVPAVPVDESIFRLRHPGNRIAAGTRVVLSGSTIQVTATSGSQVWIQEAGGDSRCDMGDDAVAYRAIVVTPSGHVPQLARGQRVQVEGVVSDAGGHRTLEAATVVPVGVPGEPYVPHCQRDASKLDSDALDGVLVVTAGTTESLEPPTSGGAWSLAICFGTSPAFLVIGAEMTRNDAWRPSWYWVTGVLIREASGPRLEPRDAEDIVVRRSDDACL
jgi:hypothetical protein